MTTPTENKKNSYSIAELQIALSESLKFQSHYAELLNMYDGGERISFKTNESWIERLREIGTLKEESES